MTVYTETRRALADARTERGVSNELQLQKWPEWLKLVLAAGSVIVTMTLAYSALDKRIDLLNQKLDLKLDGIAQQLHELQGKRP